MNENFLQDNPLKLFDDFVQIPDQAFEDGRDITEINSLIETIMKILFACLLILVRIILKNLIIMINNLMNGLIRLEKMFLVPARKRK